MTTPQDVTLRLDPAAVGLAARLAEAMKADPEAAVHGIDDKWTWQDVVSVAFLRGVDALAQQYLNTG